MHLTYALLPGVWRAPRATGIIWQTQLQQTCGDGGGAIPSCIHPTGLYKRGLFRPSGQPLG